jgi:AraC-like DNA-binding protein
LPDAQATIEALIEYQHQLNDVIDLGLRFERECALLTTDFAPGFATRELAELTVAIFCRTVKELLRGAWRPESIHFRHSAPADMATCNRIFSCRLEFNSAFDGISCSADSLRASNPSADRDMAAHARRLLRMLPDPRTSHSLSDGVRHSLYLLLHGGHATVEAAAHNLAVSPRSLQRQLEREGTSFGKLLNETRRELAVRYLDTSDNSITDIAHLTGYSAHSAFTRWFVSEFGETPAERRGKSRR